MKYVVIQQEKSGDGDLFSEEFSSLEEAIEEAKGQWAHLVTSEKKVNKVWVLESVNPDDEAIDHLDGWERWSSEWCSEEEEEEEEEEEY